MGTKNRHWKPAPENGVHKILWRRILKRVSCHHGYNAVSTNNGEPDISPWHIPSRTFPTGQFPLRTFLPPVSADRTSPLLSVCQCELPITWNIRQLSYRKEDRAMLPIYGCPGKFRESWLAHAYTFLELCNGRLRQSILRTCVQNWKFVVVRVPEIIGPGTQKIWAVPGYAHAPFSPKFLRGFCSDGPYECTCQI